MFTYLIIGIGGGIGAISRVALSKALPQAILGIPFSIMFVNIIGCFIMGILTELMVTYLQISENMKYFLISGFLGGFTTFSSFSLEFGNLWEKDQHAHAIIYASLSVVVSLVCFFLGVRLIRILAW